MKDTGKLSIDELVAIKVKEELSKYAPNYKPVSKEWVELRKEIDSFIRNTMIGKSKYSYSTCQNQIYTTIRSITECSRIDMLEGQDVETARRIFNFYKTEFDKKGESVNGTASNRIEQSKNFNN